MEMKIKKNGKEVNVNYGGKAFQEKMMANGWRLKTQESCNESAQELYDRLAATGLYNDIKVYWSATQIKGLHKYFAFVR